MAVGQHGVADLPGVPSVHAHLLAGPGHHPVGGPAGGVRLRQHLLQDQGGGQSISVYIHLYIVAEMQKNGPSPFMTIFTLKKKEKILQQT